MTDQPPKKNVYAVWWPKITDESTARKAAQNGAAAAAFCAVITGVFSIFGWFGMSKDGLWDAAIFAVIAWGIFKMSRMAAIIGLVLYLFERIYAWTQPGAHPNVVIAFLFMVMFIGGVCGTFSYYRFRKSKI